MKKDNDQGIPNANSTEEEQKLLQLMAKCWVELISNAQRVIAWSYNAIDITLSAALKRKRIVHGASTANCAAVAARTSRSASLCR